MSLLKRLKPKFWDYHDVAANHQLAHFSFRRKWKLLVLVTTLVAFAPLAALTIIGYDATTDALETEIRENTYSLVSNTLRFITALRGNTADVRTFGILLDQLDLGEHGDAFIVDGNGTLLTTSRLYGDFFTTAPLSIPVESPEILIFEKHAAGKGTLIIGHVAIAGTSMRLVMVRLKDELMAAWQKSRTKLLMFLAANVVVIILVILGMATYLVNRIHAADAKRVTALHQVEYANKIASLSRLSAGVAHEINNPLAIIGEKTGLLKDLLVRSTDSPPTKRLAGLADDSIAAVKRCGDITQRLLNFARHMETRYEIVDLGEIITEMVSFLQKEAEYRHIHIHIDFPDHFPKFESDRGNLQQIFLNLLNNAFAAMDDEGQLDISGKRIGEDKVEIVVADDGHGIPEEDLPHIFEPFFSSKTNPEGTGLGLSVTYGFIREIGGRIRVESQVGEGTRFIIELPLNPELKERKNVCSYY